MNTPIITESIKAILEEKKFKKMLFILSALSSGSLFIFWPTKTFSEYFLLKQTPIVFFVMFFLILCVQIFLVIRITTGTKGQEGVITFAELLGSSLLTLPSIIAEKTAVLIIINFMLFLAPLPMFCGLYAISGLTVGTMFTYLGVSSISLFSIQLLCFLHRILFENRPILLLIIPWAAMLSLGILTYHWLPAGNIMIGFYNLFYGQTELLKGSISNLSIEQNLLFWNGLYILLLFITITISLLIKKRNVLLRRAK